MIRAGLTAHHHCPTFTKVLENIPDVNRTPNEVLGYWWYCPCKWRQH
jgi:hypothetical protein